MRLLAVDTSSAATIVGLEVEGELLDGSLAGRAGAGPAHSREILPAVERLLAEAGLGLAALDGMALGRGPGSFTGIRIGVGLVQGLAYGLGLPVALVSSLACRAQCYAERERLADGALIAVALKARLTEVYYGGYRMEGGLAVACQKEVVAEASAVPPAPASAGPGAWHGLGDAWEFRSALEGALGARMSRVALDSPLSAAGLTALGRQALNEGRGVPAMQALPEYLREEVAAKQA